MYSEKKGVTLVEILIAFMILTLAAFGAASLISHGQRATRHDFRQDEAMQILVDRLNRLSALPFSMLKNRLRAKTTYTLNSGDIEGIEFGKITSGNNKYKVEADLQAVTITLDNLLELDFSNSSGRDYIATAPYTWYFRDRDPLEFRNEVIKIHAKVTPINGNVAKEKTFEAITYVCNMEKQIK